MYILDFETEMSFAEVHYFPPLTLKSFTDGNASFLKIMLLTHTDKI